MRLFIAIRLTENMKDALLRMQNTAMSLGMTGSFTPMRNMHITLAFIGEFERPDEIVRVMKSVPFEPFDITLKGVGTFGSILWGGADCPDSLFKYVKALRKKLDDRGIPYDIKPFNPHITVCRKFDGDRSQLSLEEVSMRADRVSLMVSEKVLGVMEYREIAKVTAFS